MRLLDRYLLRELLVPLSYCLCGFMIFWLSFDVFTELGTFQKLKLTAGDIVRYYLVKSPEILVVALPVAFLLALLYALTNHARYHELTAMRAAGVSLGRLALPYFVVGFLLSVGQFLLNEFWVPQTAEAAEQIVSRQNSPQADPARRQWDMKQGFYDPRSQRHWFIEAFNLATYQMLRPHVVWGLPDGGRREIMAERCAWLDGVWVFTNVYIFDYAAKTNDLPAQQQQMPILAAPEFKETPEQMKSTFKMNRLNTSTFRSMRRMQFSIREILEYQRLHPGDRPKAALLDTKLQERLASPWTSLVVVLIALPFGAAPGRRNVFVGVASSIVICFVYFVVQQLALALGTGGHIPSWVAAWAPNAMFAFVGLALCQRIR